MITGNPSDRKGFIGGSDVQHVLSIPPYGCARLLWYKKTGALPDRPFETSGVMTIGTVMEEWVAVQVAEATGWRLIRRGAKSDGVLGVHIDREVQKARETPGVAEIKIIGDNVFWSWMRDGVALGYMLQLQHGMMLWQRDWGIVAAWNRDAGGKPHVFQFEYDSKLAELVRSEIEAFWSLVESRTAPAPLEPRDERCDGCEYGATCREQEWVNVADNGLVRIEVPEFAKWQRFKAIAKEAEVEADALRPAIEAAIGNEALVQIDMSKIHFKPQDSWRVDIDALKREYPEIAAALMRKSVSRPLRVYPIKKEK